MYIHSYILMDTHRCTYIVTYMHTCTHTHIETTMHACTYTCTHVHTHTRMHATMHTTHNQASSKLHVLSAPQVVWFVLCSMCNVFLPTPGDTACPLQEHVQSGSQVSRACSDCLHGLCQLSHDVCSLSSNILQFSNVICRLTCCFILAEICIF